MQSMEGDAKRRQRRKNIQRLILESVAFAGVLSIAAVAPNVLVAIKKLGLLPTDRQQESIARARKRLIQQGLLVAHSSGLSLTAKGRAMLHRTESGALPIKKPRRWDKKWRVLIFDIPERKKRVRDMVRRTLSETGMLRIQDSVWLYPYDCEEAIALLKTDLAIGKELLYMIVDSLENDTGYRQHFRIH